MALRSLDLMIGDWIFDTIRQKSVRVDGLSYAGIRGEEDVVYYRDDVYEPIPLTAEMLEKNGIKYQWGKLWYQGGFDGVFELRYNNSQDIAFGDTPTVIQIPISYVHQLQHALRLCGIYKEITL